MGSDKQGFDQFTKGFLLKLKEDYFGAKL